MEATQEIIEKDMIRIGATAIEDKLQDEVGKDFFFKYILRLEKQNQVTQSQNWKLLE